MKTKYPFADLHEDYKEFVESEKPGTVRTQEKDTSDWDTIRKYYPLESDITYLNSGTEGSMSKQVLELYDNVLKKWAGSPSYYFAFNKITQDWQKINRAEVAKFLNTTEDNIVITDNTTEGISMVLFGLDFKEGDEVIISLQEYPSLVSALNILCQTCKITYKIVPIPTTMNTEEEIVAAFANSISKKTKAICTSHIPYTTGLRMPVEKICKMASKKNIITLIDGAHAMGMLPLDLPDIDCDFYSGAGHKWLNGPPGTGFLYIKNAKENKYNLKPILSELYGFETQYSISDMLQIRGCNNAPGFTALVEAISLNKRIGKDRIFNRIIELSNYVKEKILDKWGDVALLSPYGKEQQDMCTGITTFVPSSDINKRYDSNFITNLSSKLIDDYKIWIRYINFIDNPEITSNKTWALRVSTNLFNDFKDIDKLMNTLYKLC